MIGLRAHFDRLSPEVARQLVAVCEHEAAHGVTAHALGVPVMKVEILPDCSRNAGEAHPFPIAWMRGGLRKRLRADLLLRLAGPATNAPALTSWAGPDSDFPTARRFLRVYGGRLPGGAPWTLGDLLRDARAILSRPAVKVMHEAVTAALIERWTLGGAEVHRLCKNARRRYRRERRRAKALRP